VSRTDKASGRPVKREFGAWVLHLFRILAAMRRLRGTWFDPFGWQTDRRLERRLIVSYEQDIDDILAGLTRQTLPLALDIASIPKMIRGFGPVKRASASKADERRTQAWENLRRVADARQATKSAAE
jgi:indolepyruvate ferredoxin oxidoreductase